MPFNIGCSGHKRNVVQVDDLPLGSVGGADYVGGKRVKDTQLQVEFWLEGHQPHISNGFFS